MNHTLVHSTPTLKIELMCNYHEYVYDCGFRCRQIMGSPCGYGVAGGEDGSLPWCTYGQIIAIFEIRQLCNESVQIGRHWIPVRCASCRRARIRHELEQHARRNGRQILIYGYINVLMRKSKRYIREEVGTSWSKVFPARGSAIHVTRMRESSILVLENTSQGQCNF